MSTWESELYTNYKKVFAGVIDRPVSKDASLAGNGKFHGITCADWHYFADKRIMAKAYQNMAAGEIVRDILTNYLVEEGITEGDIQEGPIIIEAVFNYVYITDALDSLKEKAAFDWYIDADKQLHFFEQSTRYAPSAITEKSDIKNIEVEPAAEEYRNRQYIRAGKDITDLQTATFPGDGKTKTFTVAYEIAVEPTIKVDGVEQTVGIRGVEEGFQWYWNKGDKIVTPDNAAAPLTSAQTLEVIYRGYFDVVVMSYDLGAIDSMKTIEGGTGIHDNVLDDPYLTSRQSAFESANAKLKKYAKIGNRFNFDTHIKGLRAGQLINVDLPSFDIYNTDFLIESVKASELGTHDGRLIYQVSCVDGAATGGWANFFKKISTSGQSFVIYENIQEGEMLITLDTFSKTWLESDNPNIFKSHYPSETLYPEATLYPSFNSDDIEKSIYPGEDLYPSRNLFPSFNIPNRINYIALFDVNDVEVFRKPIVKEISSSEGQVTTTAMLLPYEVNNIQIAHIAWIGGVHATEAFGSGTIIDKQPYNKLKTELESVQIQRTDVKGW